MAEETDAFRSAVASVRRQKGAARLLARGLLGGYGRPRAPILSGSHGQLLWPKGIVGSLAHDSTMAAAVIATRKSHKAVGIDIEPDKPMPEDTANIVVTRTESARYSSVILQSRLLFCLKEAAYKAFYTLEPRFLEFQEVEVDLDARSCRSQYGLCADITWSRGTKLVALATFAASDC